MNDLTGERNVILGGLAMGMSREEITERYQDIVDFSGINEKGDFITLPMRTYSSGMAARLRFSIAAAKDHDVLMIDEALATGDREVPAALRGAHPRAARGGRHGLPGQPQQQVHPRHLRPRAVAGDAASCAWTARPTRSSRSTRSSPASSPLRRCRRRRNCPAGPGVCERTSTPAPEESWRRGRVLSRCCPSRPPATPARCTT